MSESLLFALLGFLVACLIGTVFASFLWRRAVSVTTRRLTENENFAAQDEVADLKADLRAAQNTLTTKDREVSEAEARTAELEAAIADAQATGEGAAAELKRELQNASEALMAAHTERDAAKAALSARAAEIVEAKARVTLLESAIRTLAHETSLFDAPATMNAPDEEAASVTSATNEEQPGETTPPAVPPAPKTIAATPATSDDDRMESSLAMTRSLEERIEALKQGEQSPS